MPMIHASSRTRSERRAGRVAEKRQWSGRGKGTSLGNRFFMVLIRALGVLPAYAFLIPACLSYALFDRPSRQALRTFRSALGRRCGFTALYRHFYCFGMSLVDRFSFLVLRRCPFTYTCNGEERIAAAAGERNGVILLSAHVGNWEIAGNLLNDRLDVPINVLMLDAEREALRRVYQPALEKRRFRAIAIVPNAPDAMVETVARLRQGEIVCLLGDRLLDGRTMTAPFLGRPARFPIGPFAVAALTGAPIIPVFTLKTGLRHYTFTAYEPITVSADRRNRDDAIRRGLARYVAILEEIVRMHPYQWYNFYDFWK
ncbi:MAG: hypothetical protein GF331_23865 [Chitinivibrionales bacterium]|nr:hypothetical protein [Chitinivibrionales bacterium]